MYSLEDQQVGVIRIADKRSPGSLLTYLTPHLRDPDISKKVLFIRRKGSRYSVEARPLTENASRGEGEIEHFLKQREGGLDFRSAFLHLTPEEYADIERVRRKLDAVGGFEPPGKKPEAE